ncbi:hypothetical protein BV25DRAFT_1919875 [Artomyces pyxidatus]|uniref:Uncharacterized protein n=1 Tax=Artomyces pyxidatus TaxID=48021 RepID=A0ACB8SN16_9AGAM|nr:hypothetical protein BV25DRAFT_1919875 [Artomyces pyxidatus]
MAPTKLLHIRQLTYTIQTPVSSPDPSPTRPLDFFNVPCEYYYPPMSLCVARRTPSIRQLGQVALGLSRQPLPTGPVLAHVHLMRSVAVHHWADASHGSQLATAHQPLSPLGARADKNNTDIGQRLPAAVCKIPSQKLFAGLCPLHYHDLPPFLAAFDRSPTFVSHPLTITSAGANIVVRQRFNRCSPLPLRTKCQGSASAEPLA